MTEMKQSKWRINDCASL